MEKKILEKKDKRTELQKEYDDAVKLLKAEIPGTDAYKEQLEIVERINKMIMDQEDRKKKISPDVIVNGAVSLIGIGSILCKERVGVIASKALAFVKKPR